MSKLDLFHKDVVTDYCVNGLSLRDLEKKYGINRTYIKAHMVKHGVPMKKRNTDHNAQEKLDDPVWMADSYSKTLSARDMGEVLGVSNVTVLKYLKKHGIAVSKDSGRYLKEERHKLENIPRNDFAHVRDLEYASNRVGTHRPRSHLLQDREHVLKLYREHMNIQVLADIHEVSYSTMQNAIHYHDIPIVTSGNTSHQEKLIADELCKYRPIRNAKLEGVEVDIYFPDKRLAVEIHGLRFHSEIRGGKNRSYHQNKYEACERSGVRLIQFFEGEITGNKKLIVDMLRVRLGDGIKLNARDYDVAFDLDVRGFLKENHLQGSASYTSSLSLIDKTGVIMATMTFVKSRNSQYDMELNRFAVRSGFVIRGGFSRLLKYRPSGVVVSYSDCRYSNGNVYQKNGFRKIAEAGPIYYYTKDYRGSPLGRMAFQHSRLKSKLENYDCSLTEWENLRRSGYDRIWACKTYTWVI